MFGPDEIANTFFVIADIHNKWGTTYLSEIITPALRMETRVVRRGLNPPPIRLGRRYMSKKEIHVLM